MQNKQTEKGSILIGTLIIIIILIGASVSLASIVLSRSIEVKRSYSVISALSLAEAGVEKTMWEINNGSTFSCTSVCTLGTGQFEVSVNNVDSSTKMITSTGYVPKKANYRVKRVVQLKVVASPSTEGIAFNYAIQAGTGGISISGSSEITGSLYSNGNITASGSSEVKNPGNAWAVGSIVDGDRIKGAKYPNSPQRPLPTIDTSLWQSLAQAGGTVDGNYSPPNSGTYTDYGPKEITGDFSMKNSGQKMNLTGPLYIKGNVSISGGEIKLDNSFGSKGTVVLVDGTISISGSSKFYGNSSGSYILFVSTSTSESAISYTGSAAGEKLALFSPNGGIKLTGSGKIVAMTGKTLNISGSGEIEYESGLSSTEFSGGPGGSWIKDYWQIK